MRIAVIAQTGWHGSMGEWVADAWERNNREVSLFDRRLLPDIPLDFDLYFFVDCSEDYSDVIPEIGKPKIFWSLDAHMSDGIERSVNIARECDLIFSANYEHGVKLLEKFGIKSYLMPITYTEMLTDKRIFQKEKYDICMIGHLNSQDRLTLWKMLEENYNAQVGDLRNITQVILAMSNSKIMVNQPTEPWDIIINNRFFEAMGFGSLLLQKKLRTEIIEKMGFVEGEDFIYWNDFDDLKEKIDYYLKHEEEAKKIAHRGNIKVQRYSMTNQIRKMEAIILDKFYERL